MNFIKRGFYVVLIILCIILVVPMWLLLAAPCKVLDSIMNFGNFINNKLKEAKNENIEFK
jgi:hypothetical protein